MFLKKPDLESMSVQQFYAFWITHLLNKALNEYHMHCLELYEFHMYIVYDLS